MVQHGANVKYEQKEVEKIRFATHLLSTCFPMTVLLKASLLSICEKRRSLWEPVFKLSTLFIRSHSLSPRFSMGSYPFEKRRFSFQRKKDTWIENMFECIFGSRISKSPNFYKSASISFRPLAHFFSLAFRHSVPSERWEWTKKKWNIAGGCARMNKNFMWKSWNEVNLAVSLLLVIWDRTPGSGGMTGRFIPHEIEANRSEPKTF